jgi:SAM-dependent methyltransferase
LADAHALPFADGEFDGVFLCFVLEHLTNPLEVLSQIKRVTRAGGRLHAFEGDHESTLAWPRDASVNALVRAAIAHQAKQGGDATIGRSLAPLLLRAGFAKVTVEPCVAYADVTRPEWVEGFTRHTFIDMMLGMRDSLVNAGLIDHDAFELGIDALERAAQEGTFSYTFYRASAER